MKSIISILIIILFNTTIISQTITGRLVDVKNQPIGYANIALHNTDSAFISGATSDDKGIFKLSAPDQGDYLLSISFMGYIPLNINVNNLSRKTDLHDIILYESNVSLEEVTVTGSRLTQRVDRQIILPSEQQIKMSASGFDLLSKMMLPSLKIDPIQQAISTIGGGNVQIRINGIRASSVQVQTINPKEIVRVEYIDSPDVRYGEEDAEAVINFIMKRMEHGISGGVNLANALHTGFGDDLVYIKANHKLSEFGLTYNLSYRDLDKRKVDETEKFLLPQGNIRNREKEGIGVPFFYAIHNIQLSYNLSKPDKYILNILLKNEIYDSPDRDFSQIISETGKPDILTYIWSNDKSHTPTLDLYYQLHLPHQQELTLNAVGTYINTKYKRDYNEFLHDNQDTPAYQSAYETKGRKYSLIGEIMYDKTFKNLKLNSGIQFIQAYVNNKYTGATESTIGMHTTNVYAYTQIQGKLYSKLGYTLGVGVSRQDLSNDYKGFTFYTFRPSVMISHPLFSGANVRYKFSISPNLPQLSDLSDVTQQLDNYQMRVGNPNLEPFRSYNNTLRFTYNKNRFNIELKGDYIYKSNPIMEEVQRIDENEENLFVYSMNNQKSFTNLGGNLFIQYQLIPDKLSLSTYGGMGYFISKGNNYKHDYTSWYTGGQIDATLGNWSFGGNIWSRANSLFGETILYGEKGSRLSLRYKHKNLLLGTSVLFPFQAQGLKVGTKRLSEIAQIRNWTSSKNFGNLIILNLAWNFNTGKRYQSTQRKMNNKDMESGIVK